MVVGSFLGICENWVSGELVVLEKLLADRLLKHGRSLKAIRPAICSRQ